MPLHAKTSFFYGWVIVAFTFTVQFISIGLSYYAFSVFLKPLAEVLGTDRFYISLAMSIQLFTMAVLSPLAGEWFATLPIKNLLLAGVGCLSLGYVSLSQITELWQLYLFYGGLVGIGGVLLGVIPCNILVANWFNRRRGSAIGVSQFGISASGAILVPGVTWVLITYGWQNAFIYSGVVAAVVLVPLILWIVVKTPEEIGQHPDGSLEPMVEPASRADNDWTVSRAFKHRDILLLTFTVGPCYLGVSSVILTMPSHITDMGISALNAATVVSATTICAATAKPFFGIVSDFVDKKLAVALAVILQAAGVLVLLSASDYTMLLVAGVCFGLGYGGISPLWGLMLATRFGKESFAKVMGVNQPLLMPFSMVGLPLTTFVFESTGSYSPAYTGMLACYVIAITALYLFRLEPNAPYD